MILVDTSTWADFFNGRITHETKLLSEEIANRTEIATCGLIVAEFFQGLRKPQSIKHLAPFFREMIWLSLQEPDDYFAAAELFRSLRRRGVTVRSTIDCLLARLAEQHGASLLSSDRDIHAILRSGLSGARDARVR